MDVKYFAFLARQRAAAIQPRESFCGLPKRGLALLLANVMFWQPMWAQAAEGIVVSAPGTALNQAGNGVPIVNIAAPNGSGLSHNQFVDYNVGSNGVILNNATGRTQDTQLGGIILGNPNLQGTAATTILNEVNGGNPSQLRGYTEVAGQSAKVIVANPYGISCNGCGFINTPQVTLTTGKPVINAQGAVGGYQVDGGSVSLEGAGLNAGNVGRFDIITRSAKLNAQLHAQELNVITGRNDVDAQTLAATPRAGAANDAPALAIDSSALGGMYAGAIKLVGTEAGVGVRLAGDLIASGGDIQLDANGHVSLAQTSATGAVNVKAASLDAQGPLYAETSVQVSTAGNLTNQNNIAARDSITLNAGGTLSNRGVIEAGVEKAGSRNTQGDITVTAQNLDNTGKTMVASRDLTITTRETLNNQGGTLSAQRHSQLAASTLDNQNGGRVLSMGEQRLAASQVLNQGGLISSERTLSIDVARLDNRAGEVSSRDLATLRADNLDNSAAGKLLSSRQLALHIAQALNNSAGLIDASALQIDVRSLINREGKLLARDTLQLDMNHGHLDNRSGLLNAAGQLQLDNLASVDNQAGTLSSLNSFEVNAQSLDNRDGKLLSEQSLTLRIRNALDNTRGLVAANGLTLQAAALTNQRGAITAREGLGMQVDTALDNRSGTLTGKRVEVHSASLDNREGTLRGDNDLALNSVGVLDNRAGKVLAGQSARVSSASLENAGGEVRSTDHLKLTTAGLNNAGGQVAAGNRLDLQAGQVSNTDGGQISAGTTLVASLNGLQQARGGRVFSGAELELDLNFGHLDNQQGLITAPGQLLLKQLASVDNRGGELSSAKAFELLATRLDNRNGKVLGEQALTVRIAQALDNAMGVLSATTLDLRAATLDNQQGRVQATHGLTLVSDGALDNRGGKLLAGQAFDLRSASLDNSQGQLVGDAALTARIAGQLLNRSGLLGAGGLLQLTAGSVDNQAKGRITGKSSVELKAAHLDNASGHVGSAGRLALNVTGEVLNQAGELNGDGGLVLVSASLDNHGKGLVQSKAGVSLSTGSLNNAQGGRLLSGADLLLDAGAVDNREGGTIASTQALTAKVQSLDQRDGGHLRSDAGLSLDLQHGRLDNQGGLITSPGPLRLSNLAEVDNRNGEISSAQAFDLLAVSLDNSAGKLLSEQALTLKVERSLLNLKGVISASGVQAHAEHLDNTGGTLGSRGELVLALRGALDNRNGEVSAAGKSTLSARQLDNREGVLSADATLAVEVATTLDNRHGLIGAGQQLTLDAANLDNSEQGSVVSDGRLKLKVEGLLNNQQGEIQGLDHTELTLGQLDNHKGLVATRELLTLHAGQADNHEGVVRAGALTLHADRLNNDKGLLSADTALNLNALEASNDAGRIASRGDLQATVGVMRQHGGKLVADGALELVGKQFDNRKAGLVGSGKALTLKVDALDNRGGELSSLAAVEASGALLDNSDGGKLLAGTALQVRVEQLINRSKGLVFGQSAHLGGARLDNDGGTVGATLALTVDLVSRSLPLLDGLLDNRAGRLDSAGTLSVTSVSLNNDGGKVSSAGAMHLASSAALSNRAGLVETDDGLTLVSASLDNRDAGVINSTRDARVETGAFNNSQDARLSSHEQLTLIAGQVTNQAKGNISAKVLDANLKGLDQQGGELFSLGALTLDLNGGQLNNQGGLIRAPGALLLKNLDAVANQKGEISSTHSFDLVARSLDNSAGKLLSAQQLTVRVAEQLNNLKGLISARSLNLNAGSLNNRDGLISSVENAELRIKGELANLGGTVLADGSLLLRADSVLNAAGKLSATRDIDADLTTLDNQNGTLVAQGELLLKAATTDNRQAGLIKATKALKLEADDLDNRGGEVAGSAEVRLVGTRLNNSDGGHVLADGNLTLNVQQVLNQNKGVIQGKGDVTLNRHGLASSLNNSGGTLHSDSAVRVDLNGEVINQAGRITSEGALTVNAASLDNSSGVMSSATDLTLTSTGRLRNQGGKLVSDGAAQITSDHFDNSQGGTLSAKGALVIDTGLLENQGKGRLFSGSGLTLTSAALNNSTGGRIASNQVLKASVSGLEQQGGELYSDAGIELDLNNGQLNNQGGLITTPGQLLLKNLNGVANQGGEISSAKAYALAAQQLNNDNGKLLGNQGLTLTVNQALSNLKGKIGAAALTVSSGSLNNGQGGALTSQGDLGLTVNGLLDNRAAGLINAQKALTVSAGSLNNQDGELLAKAHLEVTAGTLDNSDNGLINSATSLTLSADELLNGGGGEVSTKGVLTLNAGSLSQQGGRVLGDAALSVKLAAGGGDLNNQGGLLYTKGVLTLDNLRDLNNRNGEISSARQFSLSGRTLDNSAGKLISNEGLTLNAATLINQAGLISGWNGLTVTGGRLDNSDKGTLSSRLGNVDIGLSGALDNSAGGALASQGRLDVSAGALNNRAGIIVSAAGQSLKTITGTLDNGQDGQIDSGAELDLWAATLDNSAGNIVAKGPLTLERMAQLNNRQGTLVSASGLKVLGAAAIDNQGGTLISQAALELNGASLDNRNKGTVAAADGVTLTTSGAVLNDADGLIYSRNAGVNLVAQRLSNQAGGLQAQGGLDLETREELDNRGGRIIAQAGDVLIKAGSIDNRGGVLASLGGALEARAGGLLRNDQNGVIQAQQLKLIALGGLNNAAGRLAAQSGAITVETANLINQGGGLYAKGLVKVTAADLDNSTGGQIAGQHLDFGLRGALTNRGGVIESDSSLNVLATSFGNQGGQLRALGRTGKTALTLGGVLDNRGGTLESANSDFNLQASGFFNTGGKLLHGGAGEFAISMANVTGAGGQIVTLGGLTLNAANWTNSSVIQAGRLTVNVGQFTQTASGQLLASDQFKGSGTHWTNHGLIASNGSLDIVLDGHYNGNGSITSLGDQELRAAQLDLAQSSRIASAGKAQFTVGGQLNNSGRLTAIGDMTVQARSLTNRATLGSGGNLLVTAQSLVNEGTPGSNSLITSGGNAEFRVDSLTNRFATVYSLGSLLVARDSAQARAGRLDNISATLQSEGTMRLLAQEIVNRRDAVTFSETQQSSAITYRCTDCNAPGWSFDFYVEQYLQRTMETDSAGAAISAGQSLVVDAGAFSNQHSTVSAAGNLTINATDFLNEGAANASVVRTTVYSSPLGKMSWGEAQGALGSLIGYAKQNSEYNYLYIPPLDRVDQGNTNLIVPMAQAKQKQSTLNPGFRPGVSTPLPTQITKYTNLGTSDVITNTGVAAGAVVQAGGTVSINATRSLGNGLTQSNSGYGAGARSQVDTSTGKPAVTTVATINTQLPPDLAQRQVNPLSLPGFTLPTGQNGLFRLSGQGASNAQVHSKDSAAPSWTLGSATISLAQREQGTANVIGRNVEQDRAAATAGASRTLDDLARQGMGLDTQGRALDVADTAGAAHDPRPGHNPDLPGITRLDPLSLTATGNPSLPGQGTAPQAAQVDASTPALGARDTSASIATATSAQPPVSSPGTLSIERVQGLPDNSGRSQAHKYLIETNPVLTDLKSFMSSDYLLGNLGYNPDQSWKRLGDGYFEQRLVQQAITARTGQRFLEGQTTDEAMFKHLMDNALVSKQALDLSVGVTLTAQQVAALTHDIVWLETHQVNGEDVLVPVLYLAQANDRLAPTGALIAGKNVNLIAGENLVSAGTLRATENLSASAGQNLVNSGLIEAGGRLSLMAGDNLVNRAGGIISGRDVSLLAISGDVLNERTITEHRIARKGMSDERSFVDSAARVEAANDMAIVAGRDLLSSGGVLDAGRDINAKAGRDLLLVSAQERFALDFNSIYTESRQTQHASVLSAGRDISLSAGNDFASVASQIEASRNISIDALNDLSLASAANEDLFAFKTKNYTRQRDQVRHVGSELDAGGDVTLKAGHDLSMVASQIRAGDEAYLVAGNQLELLAAQDSDYSLYSYKKFSNGGEKTRRDEVTQVTQVGSQISSGGDLTLKSGGDQRYQVAKLDSGNDLTLESGGQIVFEGVKDLHQQSHEKSSGNDAWNSAKGKGNTDETLRQSVLLAQGQTTIKAVEGLKIDVRQIDQANINQTIDAMVKADPQLAWLKAAEQRGDVDWRAVKELQDSYKYSHSGLGQGAVLAIMIIVTALTAGAASTLVAGTAQAGTVMGAAGTVTTTTAAGVTTTTAVAAGWGNVMASSVLTSMASGAAVSTVNNKGDLGAVFKDITSTQSLQGYATGAITAGITSGYLNDAFGIAPKDLAKPTFGLDLSNLKDFGKFVAYTGAQAGVGAVAQTVVQGTSLKDNLSLAGLELTRNALTAYIYKQVGDQVSLEGLPTKVGVHAIVGGLLAEAAGGDFRSGLLAAGVNEAFVATLGDEVFKGPMHDQLLGMTSQLLGMTVAAAAGANEQDQAIAGWVTKQATTYNWLLHEEIVAADKARAGCAAKGGDVQTCQNNITRMMAELDNARDRDMMDYNRKALAQARLEGWSREEYAAKVDQYWDGIDKTQLTAGYGPAGKLDYVAGEMWDELQKIAAKSPQDAKAWAQNVWDAATSPVQTAGAIAGGVKDTAIGVKDWIESPIPGQALEKVFDDLSTASPRELTHLAFDSATGAATAMIGGKAVQWVAGKWVARTEVAAVELPKGRPFTGTNPTIAGDPYHPDLVNQRAADSYHYYDGSDPVRGSMSNVQAREWYLFEDAQILKRIDQNAPLESQAQQAFALRNENRTKARELMADRVTADRLTREEPNMTWQQMIDLRTGQGFKGEDIYRKILESSQRTRTEVNKLLGVQ
ncbi:filamentous hemagglutinin N-terminal domain-containing protein [Pseudomonas fontis]|uniref:Filamentous hemagglutinin N-terminal domain-containing protein n=1 Tax=Pseudomonas fontis TaxID=2942633 RepID=A0ABT5NUW2_9PSED|nr:filamentous hemagglutinin N-terminal domain-containing protein [Pseudomonas fontis]MDD0976809.1 filamentous hemagglutinin N-terminal domain-containing protein [Pseudomonas fontis]MDD0991967.1 filamentous hemagglutinin N-terminal domain-containing protein [Pseudomonas fontis]